MRPFTYETASDAATAVMAHGSFLAGGTTLLDLMKLDVLRPDALIDINALSARHGAVTLDQHGLHLGALARMADVAAHPDVRRGYPMVAQSLQQAASGQLRNMASLGGNVLQRTRCNYFRDVSYSACNKRQPGSGCSAIGGVDRKLAVLGVSAHCIANYPGDFANALIALDAVVDLVGPQGARTLPFADLHRLPGQTPHLETNLGERELITGFRIPATPWARRSLYLKVRDRASYEFALTSAAVALDMVDGQVRQARVALGGVGTKPWRSPEAEAVLVGAPFDEALAVRAAEAAFAEGALEGQRAYKVELGRRTLVRALIQCATMEV
jgi:xanthine dehydrogenase YagS FAD-binding subunit